MAVGRGLPAAAQPPRARRGERRLDLAVRLEADQVPFELVDGIDDAIDKVAAGPGWT